MKHNKLKTTLVFFIIALVIYFGLNLDILKDYAFLDAYELIYTADRVDNFHTLFIENGRPLYGYWCEYLYGYFFETITELKWPRIFATLFCIIFSTQLFRFLIKVGFKTYESAIFALLVLALPTLTVYFAWSTTSQIPLILMANFYAGELLLKGLTKQKIIWAYVIISFLIVFTSLFLYQSTATIFLLPFVIKAIKTNNFNLRLISYYIGFTLLCYVLYYSSFKYLIDYSGLIAAPRTSLSVIQIPKRVIKFFLIELRILIKNSGFLIFPKWSLIFGIITFCSFFILQFRQKKSFQILLVLILILPFCYAPNLLSGQSYFSLRTIPTTAIIVLFYQFWFLRFICLKFEKLKEVFLVHDKNIIH